MSFVHCGDEVSVGLGNTAVIIGGASQMPDISASMNGINDRINL